MNGNSVVFLEGVDDRNAAETLVRAILWIDQDEAEADVEENAWYDHQLVGLEVARDGAVVGTVLRVEHLPAQDLLIVKTDAGEVMVPFVEAIVPAVDVAAGRITVTPPAGLFEELPAEPEQSDADAAESDAIDGDEPAASA